MVRARHEPQVTMLAFIDLETRVPPDHPLVLPHTAVPV